MNRTVILPDVHVPIHDKRIIRAFIKFIADYQPDELLCIGDLMDYPQPSRWSKDTAAEYEGSVFEDSEVCKKEVLAPIRAVYGGKFTFIEGNHDERARVYLAKYSPALAESHAFDIDNMLDFTDYGIELMPDVYDVAPGWVATHGHRGGIRLNQVAGITALNAARKFGKNVVMGHTHRLSVVHHTGGYSGSPHTLSGMEVGHFVNVPMAGYLKGSMPNWQAGFGILTADGSHVRADAVPILNNRFTVEGVSYKC